MAIIAAGVTPEILEAAPSVGGLVFVSFSTISLANTLEELKVLMAISSSKMFPWKNVIESY